VYWQAGGGDLHPYIAVYTQHTEPWADFFFEVL
jgi:hypothetical protein